MCIYLVGRKTSGHDHLYRLTAIFMNDTNFLRTALGDNQEGERVFARRGHIFRSLQYVYVPIMLYNSSVGLGVSTNTKWHVAIPYAVVLSKCQIP